MLPENKKGLELGVIGNGTIAGLVDDKASIVWMCLPRLDGEPVFDSLLSGKGQFSFHLNGLVETEQSYDRNTAVLRTILRSSDGSAMEVVDFCPRFPAKGRTFRPATFVRKIRPLSGSPKVKIQIDPYFGWGKGLAPVVRGVSHIRFRGEGNPAGFRVTTDAPVSYIVTQTEFILDQEFDFLCGPDEPLSDSVHVIARDWLERTSDHWLTWSRRLAVPLDWQEAVIRAAITLKICVYEETGGIVAALTTSIPEHDNCERNWDYRFCWLRDAYFTVTALNRLSAVGTLEHYLSYLRNIVAMTDGGHIQPVYGIGREQELTEEIMDHLPGYKNNRPVRNGNQAAEHIQHDVYGHVILGAAQAFFDTRLLRKAGRADFYNLEKVGMRAIEVYDTPDAGIWEYRTRASVHTSSALMCWAACDRLYKIAIKLGLAERARYWQDQASLIKARIIDQAWNPKRGAFTGAYGDDALDASVLLMAEVGFLPADDERFVKTVSLMNQELRRGNHMLRYATEDDFGAPQTAFTACTFWNIDALARIGRREEAKEVFESILAQRTKLGLMSEDIDPKTGELWGNFPQTYSMVGIINSANILSQRWDSAV